MVLACLGWVRRGLVRARRELLMGRSNPWESGGADGPQHTLASLPEAASDTFGGRISPHPSRFHKPCLQL